MSSGPENSAVFLYTFDVWLSHCIMEFQVAFLDTAADCVKIMLSTLKPMFLIPCCLRAQNEWEPMGGTNDEQKR